MNYEKFGFFGMPVWEKRIYIFSEKAFFPGWTEKISNKYAERNVVKKKCIQAK